MSSIPELDVERALPAQSAAALATFVGANPHWRGAEWADCLSALYDCDANLEVTEPIYEQLTKTGFVTEDTGRYVTRCTLTLWWATGHVTADEVETAVNTVMDSL